mmetsp:Transcript_54390/g.126636  ORF Transcript_54390/g.126636 Transcript_54390/m.126636 type:complete len:268 (-) Transcript_54390:97-900(-)
MTGIQRTQLLRGPFLLPGKPRPFCAQLRQPLPRLLRSVGLLLLVRPCSASHRAQQPHSPLCTFVVPAEGGEPRLGHFPRSVGALSVQLLSTSHGLSVLRQLVVPERLRRFDLKLKPLKLCNDLLPPIAHAVDLVLQLALRLHGLLHTAEGLLHSPRPGELDVQRVNHLFELHTRFLAHLNRLPDLLIALLQRPQVLKDRLRILLVGPQAFCLLCNSHELLEAVDIVLLGEGQTAHKLAYCAMGVEGVLAHIRHHVLDLGAARGILRH